MRRLPPIFQSLWSMITQSRGYGIVQYDYKRYDTDYLLVSVLRLYTHGLNVQISRSNSVIWNGFGMRLERTFSSSLTIIVFVPGRRWSNCINRRKDLLRYIFLVTYILTLMGTICQSHSHQNFFPILKCDVIRIRNIEVHPTDIRSKHIYRASSFFTYSSTYPLGLYLPDQTECLWTSVTTTECIEGMWMPFEWVANAIESK